MPGLVSGFSTALDHVASAIDWHCQELESLVHKVAILRPPCFHRFSAFTKRDRNGLLCDVVLEADVGTTAIKVQFSGDNRADDAGLGRITAWPIVY